MSKDPLNMNNNNSGIPALTEAGDVTKGGLFIAGLICAAAVVLLVYVVRDRIAHRRCCTDEKVLELSRELGVYDAITSLHSQRMAELTRALLEELGLSRAEQRSAWIAAQVHDIGKKAISEEVLLKPGPLTGEEWQVVKEHPAIASEILEAHGFCSEVVRIVRHHHERWDGTGYPAGLVGYQIPLGARVLAVVDGFDAMTNDRPYRSAMRLNEAIYSLRAGSGTQWDPDVVEAFLRLGIPPMFMESAAQRDGLQTTGRAGGRLKAGARPLARSSSRLPLAS